MQNEPFRMVIEDVFWLTGRPFPVVSGRNHRGVAAVGDKLEVTDDDGTRQAVALVRGIDFVCRPGAPPTHPMPLNLALGDGLSRDDLHVGQILRASE